MSNLRKTDASELHERNGEQNQRSYDPINNAVMQEILEEIKGLRKDFRTVFNMEI